MWFMRYRLPDNRNIVVVGHGREHVIESLSGFEVEFIVQEQQLGTGHALKQAESGIKNHVDRVLVLSGDTPLIRSSTLTSLLAWHIENNAAATVLSARLTILQAMAV